MSREGHFNEGITQANFNQTQWTIILGAADQRLPGAEAALEQLCRTYWPPIYAFLRKQGRTPEDAKDLTQGFFAHLLSKESRLQNLEPSKGKFRSFLLAGLNNYVRNEWDKAHAEKRGGGALIIPIDTSQDGDTFALDPANTDTPDKAYDRCWVSTLIGRVLEQLKQSCAERGESELFEALLPGLVGDAERGDYWGIAARLNKSEGATRVAAHRLKSTFREMLRQEVGRTVATPGEVDAELRELFTASLA
jgi:RNA polymerase sigma-70 factor (ECF subfamily)